MLKRTLIAAALATLAAAAPARDLGRDLERDLGQMEAKEIESTYGVVNDPLLTGWVNRLGQRLASVSGRTNVKYSFTVLDSDDVNAEAAPGGFIFVNRGTLRFVESEDELAAVMGHEVGHVAGRHAMKQLNAQLLGTLALVGFQSVHAETLKTVGGIAGGLAMLKYSRDEENDADRRGLRNATGTGYDGQAMLTFFRRLDMTEKEKANGFEVYFMTHPPTPERLRRISNEPGTAQTASNCATVADGLVARSLYRQAADAYARAIRLDPDNTEYKRRLADSYLRIPRPGDSPLLSREGRDLRLTQLEAIATDIAATRTQVTADVKQLADSQKEIDGELDQTARSLTTASQMISRRDTARIHQFSRMARTFDQATKLGGNLRYAREAADTVLNEADKLRVSIRHAVESGDSSAGPESDALTTAAPGILTDVKDAIRRCKGESGDCKHAARQLHIAADGLMNSFRQAVSLTSGQYDLLDLQVSASQNSLDDSIADSRKALSQVSHAHLETQIRRIDFATRAIPAEDGAVAGIISHYIGCQPAEVNAMRASAGFGESALKLAEAQMTKAQTKKGSPPKPQPIQPENASVLFGLMARDLDRETETR